MYALQGKQIQQVAIVGPCGQYHRRVWAGYHVRKKALSTWAWGQWGTGGLTVEQLLMWRVEGGVCQVASRMAVCRAVGSLGAIE